ncbi:MBL fold metallo-hydrolase [Ureibacillus acetophenoni]|uniref:Ribonuclease J n=1 Tax=Ureibacillus acetophenoni TaxID=614649 RepID=A0A285URY0_9BACL|nr:MBL fold metallo-hydrolase [Ureibacillus acetophenoni]SOC44614.1 ribonuclease J [Ureibacillus acetophenoni]
MPTIIKFYRGLKTIGGTIIEIQSENASILFDFGSVFNGDKPVLDGVIQERKHALVRDLIKIGAIPAIDGYYESSEFTIEPPFVTAEKDPRERAVFISHLHLDHMAYMGCISKSIPVYMSTDSLKLYKSLSSINEEVVPYREYQGVPYDTDIQVGDIVVRFVPVDHDIPGASALIITTHDGKIIYSGDLRLHGNHPEFIESFLGTAKAMNPSILIMEGTTLSFSEETTVIEPSNQITLETLTEGLLPTQIEEQLKQTDGIGIFNIYHRNIERMIGMIEGAKKAGRITILEPETAYLAQQFYPEKEFVTYCPKGSKEYALNEKTIYITLEEINEKPSSYFLQNSYHHLLELLDINLKRAIYIHSNGAPLGDYDPSYNNLLKFLNTFQVPFVSIGTGGHAHEEHLKYIVDEINPDYLIPLHSFKPERLLPKDGIQVLPDYNESFIFENGQLTSESRK